MSPQLNPKKTLQVKTDRLFEVGWEVCNKVGGIYTVLSSKAVPMLQHYRKNYCLIGPYFPKRAQGEFEELPPEGNFKKVFEQLEKEENIKCHLGKWLINGQPNVILVDFKGFWPKVNEIKKELWEDYKIDSLHSPPDFNEPLVWSYAVGKLIEKLALVFPGKKITAHFHEWLSGAGLLYLKKKQVKVGTVFTTHATALGRTLAFHRVDFYSKSIDPDKEAANYNIKAKHQLEKVAAQTCNVFTTVSEMTAIETEGFLGRKPDLILPNGLDAERFLSFEELTIKHRVQRNRLREFVIFYFFPYYGFDIEQTLFYFITGRYEVKAKGIDVFIRALSELNSKLIRNKSRKNVIAFLWIPAQTRAVLPEILESRELFQDIKDSFEEVAGETEEKLFYTLVEGKPFSERTLFTEDFLLEMKKKLLKIKRKGSPPLCTHELEDTNDYILNLLNELGLNNKKQDKVKVVFYPTYLSGHDGLSNLNYQESIQACHLGAFPSFYESWGYTPLETGGAGVAAVTTDLAGFGRFRQNLPQDPNNPGIFVLERMNKTDDEVVRALADIFYRYSKYTHKQRVENKIQARKIAAFADWQNLIKHYIAAHNQTRQ